MRLNPDYVRDILLYIEEKLDYTLSESGTPYQRKGILSGALLADDCFSKCNRQELTYALELLIKEEFIDLAFAPKIVNGNIVTARIIGLTWTGHELLDSVRDKTIWTAVKKRAAKFGGASIGVLAGAAKTVSSAMLTDPNAFQNFLAGVDNIMKMLP